MTTGLMVSLVVLVVVWRVLAHWDRKGPTRHGSRDNTGLQVSEPNAADAQKAYETEERAYMPAELRHAPLVLSEQTLYADWPVKLVARVDQVFDVTGLLVPIETKTRERLEVDGYDALELAVQAAVLANTTDPRVRNRRVATYGYVRIVRTGRPPVYLKTDLVSEQTVASYHQRYHALRRFQQPKGQVGIRGASTRRICRRCPYQAGCPYQPQAVR